MARATTSGARSKLPLLIAAVLGVVLILIVRACVTGGSDEPARSDKPSRADRAGCTPLNVTASSEKAALMSAMADDYNAALEMRTTAGPSSDEH